MRTIDAYQNGGVIQADTATLLSRVLWITTVGFLFTALGAYIAPDALPGVGFLAVVIVNFALIFGIQFVSRRAPGVALALFYLFTVLMGVEVGPLIKMYLHMANGQAIVFQAAGTTALGMAAMAIVAEFARFNYVKVGRIAMFALFGLILIGIFGMFIQCHTSRRLRMAFADHLQRAAAGGLYAAEGWRSRGNGGDAGAVDLPGRAEHLHRAVADLWRRVAEPRLVERLHW